jgi:hypothetical protein
MKEARSRARCLVIEPMRNQGKAQLKREERVQEIVLQKPML